LREIEDWKAVARNWESESEKGLGWALGNIGPNNCAHSPNDSKLMLEPMLSAQNQRSTLYK